MATTKSRPGQPRTRCRIVKLLKTVGPMDSATLAARIGVTPMAVRQHLYALESEKLVDAELRSVPIGRPAKYWRLTPEADRLFPEAYAELSVSLIKSVTHAFGSSGMTQLLAARLEQQRSDYRSRVDGSGTLEKKLQQLARVRTEEGYMAEVHRTGRHVFLFVENHCPICAAASSCLGFCASELELFQSVLGPGVSVERQEHIIGGDRRCAYKIAARALHPKGRRA